MEILPEILGPRRITRCNPDRSPPRLVSLGLTRDLGQHSPQIVKARNESILPPKRHLLVQHRTRFGVCLYLLKAQGCTVIHYLPLLHQKALVAGSLPKLKLSPLRWLLKLRPLHREHHPLRHGPCSNSNTSLRTMGILGLLLLHALSRSLVIIRRKYIQRTSMLTGNLYHLLNVRFRKCSRRRVPYTMFHSQVAQLCIILHQSCMSHGNHSIA